jgi:capsular polysaccharide transport system permease protein
MEAGRVGARITGGMEYALTNAGMLKAQWRIILALMLHDIKSRFGGSALGFLAMGVLWPLSHMTFAIVIYTVMGRAAPYGESTALWFATGVVPFLGFQYLSRYIVYGVMMNRSLLALPIVKVTDILFAGAIIEVLNAGLVVLIVCAAFWTSGIDFLPRDIVQASEALLSMMFLGLAWGVLNAIIAGVFRLWFFGFILIQILLWVTSGIVILPDALPEAVRTILSYLPTVQGVAWMRSAYYEGYGADIVDKTYLITFALITLFIGLLLERLVRGKITMQ